MNLTLNDKTEIFAPSWPKFFADMILKQTTSVSIKKGDIFKVSKLDENSHIN